MLGFRFRIKDLPEEPDEPRIPIYKLFLPIALFFLAFGGWACWKYYNVTAPPDSQLHELRLQDLTNATGSHDPTRAVQTIHLVSRRGSFEYRSTWPRFEQVRSMDTNLSLLVDGTNGIWAIKSSDGTISERRFFLSVNREIKMIYGFCALFCLPSGLLGLAAFLSVERALRRGEPLPESARFTLRARQIVLVTFLFGYLAFFWLALVPLLGKVVPFWVLGLIWVLSGGYLGNLLVGYLRKWRTKPNALQ